MTPSRTSVASVLGAGAAYFGVVFFAGFVLGTIRVLALVPVVGERYAELLEMPLMLTVVFVAARRMRVSRLGRLSERLMAGLFALALLLAAEFSLVLWMRGLTIGEYWESRDPVSGGAYLISLLVFGVAPARVGGLPTGGRERG